MISATEPMALEKTSVSNPIRVKPVRIVGDILELLERRVLVQGGVVGAKAVIQYGEGCCHYPQWKGLAIPKLVVTPMHVCALQTSCGL